MSKKKPVLEVSLVMTGFQPGLPAVVIRPTGLANQRLLINISGWQSGHSKAEMRLAVSPLTRRYGKLEDIIHTKDLIKLVHTRSKSPNIEKEQKVKVSYTSFNFLMTSGGKRYFVVPQHEGYDVLSFGKDVFFQPAVISRIETNKPGVVKPTRPGNPLGVIDAMSLPEPVVKTIANFVEGD